MPIYEYVCDDCGERYERIVMNQRTAVSCPKCESKRHTIQLSVFAAHGKTGKSNGAEFASSTKPDPSSGSGGGCCGGGCGCH
jgi:putative FmdB family regulatory protein